MRRVLIVLLLMCVLSSAVCAAPDSSLTVEVWPDGIAEVRAQLVIDSREQDTITIPAVNPEFVSVNDDTSVLRFAALEGELIVKNSREEAGYPLELRYQTASMTSKIGDEWMVSLDLSHPFWSADELAVVVSIPSQAAVISYTEGGIIYSDNEGMYIGWRPVELDTPFEVRYSLGPKSAFIYNRDSNVDGVLAIILLIILAGILLVFIYNRYLRKVSPAKKDILSALDNKERAVMEALIESDKERTQIQLAKETGLSKASVSRAVKRLSEKSLIVCRDFGTATLITLSDNFSRK